MKKSLLVLIIIALSISCKKPDSDAEPIETICIIQKVSYDDGNYEVYKFDANNRLASTILTYKDMGKIIEVPLKYEYNAAGKLLKTIGDDGYIDEYVYDATGFLTRVDFKDPKGQLTEQFTVTMDAKKRITKIVTKVDGIEGTYEYNGPNGVFSKSEVKWEGKILDQYIVSGYESDQSKKGFDIAITGHPFDPAAFSSQVFYYTPFNFGPVNSLPTVGKVSTQYNEDWSEVTDKIRVYYDFKATRKYNSNNFVMERTSADAIENKNYIKSYAYSNCN
jgi:YD repeat-containing protein